MENKKQNLRWTIFGLAVTTLLFVLAATYLIVRICDGYWASWQLPVVLVVVFLTVVSIGGMWVALPDIKKEIKE